nr:immunoglobulin heavy chain junction region [Macaca mulatta]MOV47838.1 immunoglobulin heavy chain junction region [Macaca mulatta]MOV48216.1 immunoglobulin heavy chain junction region [Macaca mulatta]
CARTTNVATAPLKRFDFW